MRHYPLLLGVAASTLLAGCEVIEGVFKAGLWTGIIGVIAVIALLVWAIAKLFR